MVGALPKPALRGFLRRNTYKMLISAGIAGSAAGAAWQMLFVRPRQKKLEEFYKWVAFKFNGGLIHETNLSF